MHINDILLQRLHELEMLEMKLEDDFDADTAMADRAVRCCQLEIAALRQLRGVVDLKEEVLKRLYV